MALAALCGAAPARRVGHIGASTPLCPILCTVLRGAHPVDRRQPDGDGEKIFARHVGSLLAQPLDLSLVAAQRRLLDDEVVKGQFVGLVEERLAVLLVAVLVFPTELLDFVLGPLLGRHEREALLLLMLLSCQVGLAATLDNLLELLLELLVPPLGFLSSSAKIAYFIGGGSPALPQTIAGPRFLRLITGGCWVAIAFAEGAFDFSVLIPAIVPIWELIFGKVGGFRIFVLSVLLPFIRASRIGIIVVARRTGVACS